LRCAATSLGSRLLGLKLRRAEARRSQAPSPSRELDFPSLDFRHFRLELPDPDSGVQRFS